MESTEERQEKCLLGTLHNVLERKIRYKWDDMENTKEIGRLTSLK